MPEENNSVPLFADTSTLLTRYSHVGKVTPQRLTPTPPARAAAVIKIINVQVSGDQ